MDSVNLNKRVISKISLTEHKHAKGFSSVGLRGSSAINIDPFLNIDLFKMSEPTFRPHPHAGFSAVTYMLPESLGAFQNRDSFGDVSLIKPGDIHWTQAGSGMMHEEVPAEAGQECLGFQIFVNLSKNNKSLPPIAFHVNADDIPEIINKKGKVRVVAGKYKTLFSPMDGLATSVTMLDISLDLDGQLDLDLDSQYNWFLFPISGEGLMCNHENITKHEAMLLSSEGTKITIAATTSRLRLLACGGLPICEPVVWGGPFCMNSKEDILAANNRFNSGHMGYLEPSF